MADDDDDTELSVAVTDDISFPWEVATVLASQASSSELHAPLQMSVLVLVPYPSSSSSSTSSSSLSAPHSPLGQQRSRARGEHYRQYTSDELEAAVAQHMKEGGTGAGAAERKDGPSWGTTAALFDVPRTTLQRHVEASISGGCISPPGRRPALSDDDERALAAWIRYQQFVNLPATRHAIYEAARGLAVARGCRQFEGSGGLPSDNWFKGFSRRHGPFRPRSSKHIQNKLPTRPQVVQWCMNLAVLCAVHNIGVDQIWNVDESGLDGRYGSTMKVIVEEGSDGGMIGSVFRDHFTVVAAVCANGNYAPPMWIAKGTAPITPQQTAVMLAGTIPGSGVINTTNGWIDQATWTVWLQFWLAHLERKPSAERPVLLVLDSHSSRFTWQAMQFAIDHHVMIYALLPNTTAFAQPLDVLIFGSFKAKLHAAIGQHRAQQGAINRMTMIGVADRPLREAFDIELIRAAFRQVGYK